MFTQFQPHTPPCGVVYYRNDSGQPMTSEIEVNDCNICVFSELDWVSQEREPRRHDRLHSKPLYGFALAIRPDTLAIITR